MPIVSSPQVSIRRNLQQVVHCAVEALSVVEHDEDWRCAVDDLQHARGLIDEVISRLRPPGLMPPRPGPTRMPGPGKVTG